MTKAFWIISILDHHALSHHPRDEGIVTYPKQSRNLTDVARTNNPLSQHTWNWARTQTFSGIFRLFPLIPPADPMPATPFTYFRIAAAPMTLHIKCPHYLKQVTKNQQNVETHTPQKHKILKTDSCKYFLCKYLLMPLYNLPHYAENNHK